MKGNEKESSSPNLFLPQPCQHPPHPNPANTHLTPILSHHYHPNPFTSPPHTSSPNSLLTSTLPTPTSPQSSLTPTPSPHTLYPSSRN
ncbi:hypothetical protein Pmani_005581 [Petrolisthes manimaculis]|uniref:Uncharacterized protein n=1 Tax=Petrolisthes manimaculis TaxID=1843537 RepID=A0AAE1QBW3_9EUCA|nr:hypothetical protein Pmani_005581 [Petrolisthes manimaculis]